MAYLASFLYQIIWRCHKEEFGNKAFQGQGLPPAPAELMVRRGRKAGWVVNAKGSQSQDLSPDSLLVNSKVIFNQGPSKEGMSRKCLEIHR